MRVNESTSDDLGGWTWWARRNDANDADDDETDEQIDSRRIVTNWSGQTSFERKNGQTIKDKKAIFKVKRSGKRDIEWPKVKEAKAETEDVVVVFQVVKSEGEDGRQSGRL